MLRISNKLRNLLLVCFLLLITGCKANYNITIDNSSFVSEELVISENDVSTFDTQNKLLQNSTPRQYLQVDLKWPTPAFYDADTNPLEPTKIDGVSYYTKSNLSTDNELKEKYLYYFNANDYSKSTLLNKCYNSKITLKNNIIQFKTLNSLDCFSDYPLLDELTINISTKCNVISSNADKKETNRLSWNITKDNYLNKKIEFNIDCITKQEKTNSLNLTYAYIAYVVIILVVVLMLRVISKNKNKL